MQKRSCAGQTAAGTSCGRIIDGSEQLCYQHKEQTSSPARPSPRSRIASGSGGLMRTGISVNCLGETKTGDPCKIRPQSGTSFCHIHIKTAAALIRDEDSVASFDRSPRIVSNATRRTVSGSSGIGESSGHRAAPSISTGGGGRDGQCQAQTKDKRQCSRAATYGDYCFQHKSK